MATQPANPYMGVHATVDSPNTSYQAHEFSAAAEYASTPMHVAAILLAALIILAALKASGFRAMVGIGRG